MPAVESTAAPVTSSEIGIVAASELSETSTVSAPVQLSAYSVFSHLRPSDEPWVRPVNVVATTKPVKSDSTPGLLS